MGGGQKRHQAGNNRSFDKKRRRENEEAWKSTRGDANRDSSWGAPATGNPRFEAFYRAQGFVKHEEWDDFMVALGTSLPACFRIHSDYAFVDELRDQLHGFVGKTVEIDNVEIPAVEQMHWYPSAYKLGTDRKTIRKLPELEGLHKWLMQHTDCGNITRQEAVSMVPPLALNVSPHHKCLDMCAAPGSKTSQLLEIVNRSLSDPEDQQGLVVANDSDTDRAYMLVHQCRRINSPLLIVTTHRGQMFPKIDNRDEVTGKQDGYFDRVLCDVPCSGDGTLRKNPAIWQKWSTSSALSLHPLQMIIAQRGVQLLKTGGLMVYSTCSMSPFENEAVIAELLRHFKGQLELVDAREFIPLFKARPGMTHWHVLDDAMSVKKQQTDRKHASKVARYNKRMGIAEGEAPVTQPRPDGSYYSAQDGIPDFVPAPMKVEGEEEVEKEPIAPLNYDERETYEQVMPDDPLLVQCIHMGMSYYPKYEDVPAFLNRKIRKSFFPPSEEENKWMNLERCLRCVPHDEDTGGFFVATLRKTPKPVAMEEELKSESKVEESVEVDEEAAAAAAAESEEVMLDGNKVTVQVKGYNKGLIDFQKFNDTHYEKIKDFYGFTGSLTNESMVVREDIMSLKCSSYNSAKSVYFIPHSVRDFMNRDKEQNLKVVTAGIKVLERMASKGKGSRGEEEYRLVQDGLTAVVPHITTRKVSVSIQDFCNLLGGGMVSLSTIHPDTLVNLANMSAGAVICVYKYDAADVIKPAEEEEEEKFEVPVIFADVPSKKSKKKAAKVPEPAVEETVTEREKSGHYFYAMCWRGVTRTMNVMCGKVEIESMKHQLAALGVLRPKIAAVRKEIPDPAAAGEAAVAAVAAASAATEAAADDVIEEEAVEA